MAEVIAVVSGKGGVGKTITCVMAGRCLAGAGHPAVLVELDFGLRNLDLALGLENEVLDNLADVAAGRCEVEDALLEDRNPLQEPAAAAELPGGGTAVTAGAEPGDRTAGAVLRLLPAPQRLSQAELCEEKLPAVISSLRNSQEYIFLDAPPGLGQGFQLAVSCADRAVIVLDQTPAAVRDADCVLRCLKDRGLRRIELLLTRTAAEGQVPESLVSDGEIEDLLGCPVIGRIPEDPALRLACGGLPLPADSPALAAYRAAAERLLLKETEEVPELPPEEQRSDTGEAGPEADAAQAAETNEKPADVLTQAGAGQPPEAQKAAERQTAEVQIPAPAAAAEPSGQKPEEKGRRASWLRRLFGRS